MTRNRYFLLMAGAVLFGWFLAATLNSCVATPAKSATLERITLTPDESLEYTPLPTSTPHARGPYEVIELDTFVLSVTWIDHYHVRILWLGSGNIHRINKLVSPNPIYIVSGVNGAYQIPNPDFFGDAKYQPDPSDTYTLTSYDGIVRMTVPITGVRPKPVPVHFIHLPIIKNKR